METVSIIVPCYNGEKTLARCIESVLSQTYPHFELLLIDNSSTDDSARIIYEAARADSRVLAFHCPNRGVSAARNFGLRKATGDFIEFLDADDEMSPTMLEKLLGALKKADADLAVCNYFGNPMFLSDLPDRVFDLTKKEDLLTFTRDAFGFLVPWNKLYRRQTLEGIFFDESVAFTEDELFILAALKNASRVASLSERLYHYHCAAEENTVSCIQQIVSDGDFVQNKTSIWYQGEKLLPRRRKLVRSALRRPDLALDDPDELIYARVLDFFFWEISAYAFFRVPDEALCEEVGNVLAEPAFRHSYLVEEKYGLSFVRQSAAAWKAAAPDFTALCLSAYRDVRKNAPELNYGKLFYMIFLRMFATYKPSALPPLGTLARIAAELCEGKTGEAHYAGALSLCAVCAV